MAKKDTKSQAFSHKSSSLVTGRNIVSEPHRVIQVERVRVSDEQRSSVASAIRSGRETKGSSSTWLS